MTDIVRRLLPWAIAGFVLSVISGVLLFYSSPVRFAHNIFFRYKLIALVLAGVNAWAFHTGIYRKIADWDRELLTPRRGQDRRRSLPGALGEYRRCRADDRL